MYRFNRWYLLTTFIGSLLVPLIPLHDIFGNSTTFQNLSTVPVVHLSELIIDVNNESTQTSFSWEFIIKVLFGIGTLIALLRFVKELNQIRRLYQQSEKEFYDGLVVCKTSQPTQVFSFWNTVYIEKNLFETINERSAIWIHEKTHINQKHSIDILVIEFFKLIFWFHPMVYLYERHIKMNHEYLADETVLKQINDVKSYQYQLLDYLENTNNSLASTFNFKLTKKRFIMMKSKTTPTVKMMTKAFVIFGILTTTTFVASAQVKKVEPTETIESKNEEGVLSYVGQKARPKEGIQSFYQNFVSAFDAKKIVFNDTIVYTRLRFIVEKDGSLTDIQAVGDKQNKELSEEAIRVLKTMPNWIPAEHNGEVVRSYFVIPIKLSDNK